MFDTHLAIVERHSFGVPVKGVSSWSSFNVLGRLGEDMQLLAVFWDVQRNGRTNLIATCWLFNRLVPSNMTPKEPSPIFLPTR